MPQVSKSTTGKDGAKAAGTMAEARPTKASPGDAPVEVTKTPVQKSGTAPAIPASPKFAATSSDYGLTAQISGPKASETKRVVSENSTSKQAPESEVSEGKTPGVTVPPVSMPGDQPIASSGNALAAAESSSPTKSDVQPTTDTKSSGASPAAAGERTCKKPKPNEVLPVASKPVAEILAGLPLNLPLPVGATPPELPNKGAAPKAEAQAISPAALKSVPGAVVSDRTGVEAAASASAALAAPPFSDAASAQPEHLAFALAASTAAVVSSAGTGAGSGPAPQGQAGDLGPAKDGAHPPVPTAPVSLSAAPQQVLTISGAWQPTPIAGGSGPGSAQAPYGSGSQFPAALPEAHETVKPEAQDALRTLRVQFLGDNNQRVDVRLGDAGGQLRVSVRSSDPVLTQTLQDSMPELTDRLGEQHFHTEVWMPPLTASTGAGDSGAANATPGGARPPASFFASSHYGGQGQPNGRQQGGQNHYKPAWIDDFGSRQRRAPSPRRS